MRQVWEQNCLFGSSCVVGVEQAGGLGSSWWPCMQLGNTGNGCHFSNKTLIVNLTCVLDLYYLRQFKYVDNNLNLPK